MFRGQLKTLDNLLGVQKRQQKADAHTIKSQIIDDIHQSEHFHIIREESSACRDLLHSVLGDHFLFATLAPSEREMVASRMFRCALPAEQMLFAQHSIARHFFVIESGEVEIIVDGCRVKSLGPGSYFGDLALLYNTARTASVVAIVDTRLWALDGNGFQARLQQLKRSQSARAAEFVAQAALFAELTPEQRDSLSRNTLLERYAPGAVVVSQGDHAHVFYIIASGRVEVIRDNAFIAHIERGNYFGENALAEGSGRRSATIIATEPTECYSLTRAVVWELLGGSIPGVVSLNQQRALFATAETLRHFTDFQAELLIKEARRERVAAGCVLAAAGQRPAAIYLLVEGEWSHAGRVAGAEALLAADFAHPAAVAALAPCWLSRIELQRVRELFGSDIAQLFAHNAAMLGELRASRSAPAPCLPTLADYRPQRQLDEGSYGTVFAAQGPAGARCALKVIPRARVAAVGELLTLRNEKNIMNVVDFRKLMRLLAYFKAEPALVLVCELVEGLCFEEVMLAVDVFDKEGAAFFAAQILLMLQYLNTHGIIYRDLKPQNLICRDSGYLTLIDFGTAKQLQRNRLGVFDRTFTVVGTAHYMAPEVIAGGGYTLSADYWSLGVLLFEMMAGCLPFGHDSDDPLAVYHHILRDQPRFPDWFADAESAAFIGGLLCKKPEARAGAAATELLGHAWFRGVDWFRVLCETAACPVDLPPRARPSAGDDAALTAEAFEACLRPGAPAASEALNRLWRDF